MWKQRSSRGQCNLQFKTVGSVGVRNYVWKAAPDAFRLLLLILSFCARGAFETGDFGGKGNKLEMMKRLCFRCSAREVLNYTQRCVGRRSLIFRRFLLIM